MLDLEKEKAQQEAEMEKLLLELQDAQNAFDVAASRLESVESRLPALEERMNEALERESEAIRISNAKDPQIEELGKWYC